MKRFLILLAVVCLGGCNTNDNPISADQMHNIRQKEAHDRANYNPSGAPSPNAPGK